MRIAVNAMLAAECIRVQVPVPKQSCVELKIDN